MFCVLFLGELFFPDRRKYYDMRFCSLGEGCKAGLFSGFWEGLQGYIGKIGEPWILPVLCEVFSNLDKSVVRRVGGDVRLGGDVLVEINSMH